MTPHEWSALAAGLLFILIYGGAQWAYARQRAQLIAEGFLKPRDIKVRKR